MRTELISIATDTLPLDGAFHLPDGEPTGGAVLLFHGNTMNFYVGAPRFLPPVLTPRRFACLAFNPRRHHILSIRDSRAAEGAAFQTHGGGDSWVASRVENFLCGNFLDSGSHEFMCVWVNAVGEENDIYARSKSRYAAFGQVRLRIECTRFQGDKHKNFLRRTSLPET